MLENLAIENVVLIPEFRADIFEYTADLASNQEVLNILAVPQRENAKIEIKGNENLKFGENTISIVVTAEDGITTTTYTIKAYRKTEEEEKENINNNSENTQNEEKGGDKKRSEIIANSIIAAVITVGVSIIIGMLIAKYRKSEH